jgi:hypothetical protein
MAQDTYDWDTKLTDNEKNVLSKVLKGFTQVELIVEDYWSKKVAKWFPKREIVDMAITFGSFECFDKETELLTSKGWVKCPDITIGHEIAQYNIDSKEVSFVLPKKVVSYDYDGYLHHYKNNETDICVTPNHDLIFVFHFLSIKMSVDYIRNTFTIIPINNFLIILKINAPIFYFLYENINLFYRHCLYYMTET